MSFSQPEAIFKPFTLRSSYILNAPNQTIYFSCEPNGCAGARGFLALDCSLATAGGITLGPNTRGRNRTVNGSYFYRVQASGTPMWSWNKTAPVRDEANATYGSADIPVDDAQPMPLYRTGSAPLLPVAPAHR